MAEVSSLAAVVMISLVKMDREINRLQVFFDAKPDRETCAAMRHSGFKWAPSVGAWQRQLNDNAIRAAKGLGFLQPLTTERSIQAEPVQGPDTGWRFYIIADLKTWADNAENRSPLEHFDSFEAAKARFDELRDQGYNSEITDPGPDGLPPARLTLGLESADGMSAADILHVRQGLNYLVTDFVRMERLRDMPFLIANKHLTGYHRGVIRCLLLGTEIKARPSQEIKVLRTEIHHIGNNINQIARSVNAGIARAEDTRRGLYLLDQVYELMYQVAKK